MAFSDAFPSSIIFISPFSACITTDFSPSLPTM